MIPKDNMADENEFINTDITLEQGQELKGINKYKKTISFIEDELYHTLAYLNKQLDTIDIQTGDTGDAFANPTPFNRNIYEAKKLLVEQKINALKSLAGMAVEQVRVTDKIKSTDVSNIHELFN